MLCVDGGVSIGQLCVSFRFIVGGVGFVPFENLIGRADRVMFSSAGARMVYFWTWRSDRFFKKIE